MLSSLLSILACTALATAAFGLGRPSLRLLHLDADDPLAVGVYSLVMGLIAAGGILLALAMAGWLCVPVIVVLTTIGCCWAIFEIGRAWLRAAGRIARPVREVPIEELPALTRRARLPRWLTLAVAAMAIVALSSTLLIALAPPTSSDPLGMRLELSKTLLLEESLTPHSSASAAAPSLLDLWFLWAIALGGTVCAQVLLWGLSVLLALGIVLLAAPILGRKWAWVAAALALASPGIHQQITASPDAIALVTLGTLAMAAWWQATIQGANERWLLLAGLAAGGALAIDVWAACLWCAAIAATRSWALGRQPEQRQFLWRAAGLASSMAVGVGCLYHVPWTISAHATLPTTAPGPMRWEGLDFVGAALLAALPGLLLARRLRGLGPMVVVASACALLGQLEHDGRLLLAAVPPASVAAVWAWMEMTRFPRRALRMAAAAFATMLAATILVPLVQSRAALRVAVGLEDRDDYLLCREPTYRAAIVANHVLAANAHILSQEEGVLYFDRRVTLADAFRRQWGDPPPGATPMDWAQRLRDAGFTHLLLADAFVGQPSNHDSPLCRPDNLLDAYLFRCADGSLRRYRLVALK